jgi:hypothetical protein
MLKTIFFKNIPHLTSQFSKYSDWDMDLKTNGLINDNIWKFSLLQRIRTPSGADTALYQMGILSQFTRSSSPDKQLSASSV